MTIPGLAVWIVTVTWLMPRSTSTPLTLALARRRSISWRIAMSSLSEDVYSLLSAYHFAVQVRDDDGDVGHGLVDGERATLRPWAEALDRRALIGDGIEDDQVLGRQVVVVLGIRGGAVEHARDVLGGVLRHELQQCRSFLDGLALDGRRDQSGLAGRAAKVLGGSGNTHGLVAPTSAPATARCACHARGSCGWG